MKIPANIRFWRMVEMGDGCWFWTGYLRPNGYGRFMVALGKAVYAHRYAYEQTRGSIPADLELDHLCRNRGCVNPAHLEPVTRTINLRRSPLTMTSRNAARSVCNYGHPLDGIRPRTGWRYCKTCKKNSRFQPTRRKV